jgi:hypothetical protein
MLFGAKLGVTQIDAFASHALRMEAEHRAWFPFAYTLLEDLAVRYRREDEPLLERLYRSMAGGDGIWKVTRAGRLVDVDQMIASEVARFSGVQSPIRVHDVAASNGVTTLELLDRLGSLSGIEVIASDLYDTLSFVQVPGSAWTCVFDAAGRCLQIVGHGFVLSGYRPENPRYFGNRCLQWALWSRVVPRARDLLVNRSVYHGDRKTAVRTLRLFHPNVVERARTDGRLKLIRHNLFEPAPFKAHVVRAVNVLTTRHFSQRQVLTGISACFEATLDGGMLVLGRSMDEEGAQTRATAFRKHSDRTVSIAWRLNGGYEHEALVSTVMAPFGVDSVAPKPPLAHVETR